MKPALRSLLAPASVALGAVITHEALAITLVGRDLLAALLVDHSIPTFIYAISLVLVRLALMTLIPGWLLYRAALALRAWGLHARKRSPH